MRFTLRPVAYVACLAVSLLFTLSASATPVETVTCSSTNANYTCNQSSSSIVAGTEFTVSSTGGNSKSVAVNFSSTATVGLFTLTLTPSGNGNSSFPASFSIQDTDSTHAFVSESYVSGGTPAPGPVVTLSGGVLNVDYSGVKVTNSPEVLNLYTSQYVSPTPEPNSLMLLGTGLAASAGLLRRKLFSRS